MKNALTAVALSLLLLLVTLETVIKSGVVRAHRVNELDNGWEDKSSRKMELGDIKNINSSIHYERGIDILQDGINDQACHDLNIWFVWNSQTKSCRCGDDLGGIVNCDTVTKQLSVIDCYCLTVHYTTRGTAFPLVGNCIFNCENSSRFDFVYHGTPSDCAGLNRQGTLCGQCLDVYTVPAYSYEFKCIRCDSELENWGLYTVFAFLPLTVFIFIISVFRINVLSPKLNVFVFAAQGISVPFFLRILLYILSQANGVFVDTLVRLILALYGIWNLDFLRVNILPDVCINVIPLHILVLDYLIAIYPMLLMAAAYTMAELYGFEFRPLRCIWKPFHYFFARFRRHWGIQTTIMDAFVTFFFLSTTKLLSVSCDLLISTKVYTREGKPYSRNLFYDPSIKYFGKEHLPYALMALAILTVFIGFPTSLLLCYQCKAYRKCLTKCQIHGNTVETFVESFQKYYKDGSNGTWDCRWFAGFFILFKSFCYLIYSISLNDVSFALLTVTAIIGATVVVIVQPYREEYSAFNVISANLFLWQALVSALMSRESLSSIVEAEFKDHFFSVFLLWLVPLT
jgi:hypothetical protein